MKQLRKEKCKWSVGLLHHDAPPMALAFRSIREG
jgi:hypothetical protein